MNRLIINGQEAELSEKTKIGITFQVNNLGELKNRQGNFSNVFKLPKTLKNRTIFENAENVNSNTLIPYQVLNVSYYQDGIEIVKNGTAVLQSVDSNYNIFVNSGNTDFFQLIDKLKVSDLYNSTGNLYGELHEWNLQTIFDSRTNDSFIYPFINWIVANTNQLNSNEINVRYLLPCLFVSDIFKRISAEQGFDFCGTFFESEVFQKLILTPDFFSYSDEIKEAISQNFFTSIPAQGYELKGNVPQNGGSFVYYFDFDSPNAELLFNDGINDFYPGMNGTLILNYNFDPFIDKDSLPVITPTTQKGIQISIIDTTTGLPVASEWLFDEDTQDDLSTAFLNNHFEGSLNYSGGIIAGHNYKVRITFKVQEDNQTGYNYGFDDINLFTLTFIPEAKIKFGGMVFLNSMFNIKQKDLIKDLINQFGVIVQTNSVTKKVCLNFLEVVSNNKRNAKDWSSKVDVNFLDLKFILSNYGERNNFKYKEEETILEGFGNGFFDLVNENLSEEVDAVQLVTSATESNIEDGEIIPKIKSFDVSEVFTNRNNRILILEKRDTASAITWNDFETGTLSSNLSVPFCFFQKAGEEYNLTFDTDFENNLIEKNYSLIQKILKNVKSINLILNLNSVDVYNFDFSTPIFLNVQKKEVHLNGFFYINKIESFKGGLTKCELLRI